MQEVFDNIKENLHKEDLEFMQQSDLMECIDSVIDKVATDYNNGWSIEHDGCKGCSYESEGKHGEHCSVCEGTKQGDMYKRATNADRIRAMSDEELAEWFSTVTDDVLRGSIWSKDGWMKYLQSEVEE